MNTLEEINSASFYELATNTKDTPDHFIKEAMHKKGKALLKGIVNALGLQKGEFEIRSCKGGSAVMGEVILHTNNFYIQLMGESERFMFRSCKGMKDYSGGCNRWKSYKELQTTDGMMNFLRELKTLKS